MLSRCTIRRRNGYDVVDGLKVPKWDTIYTALLLRLGGAERGSSGFRAVSVGETETQLAVRVAHFPAGTSNLADDDLIDVTAGENAGAVYRILEAAWQDQATARRVPVMGTQRPEEWS